jgi:outer membrane protein assembly factor BamB
VNRLAFAGLIATFVATGSLSAFADESWPQFRGVNGAARSDSPAKLPQEIGPDLNVVWKTALPPGHSSPVVVGDRVYLTAVRGQQLLTLAVDRATGQLLWEAEAPHEVLEEIHGIGSYAQATPAADGERVISFFGSCGLFCYDFEGKPVWQKRMGPFNNDFGAGSSPILADDFVILCQDHDTGSFLTAIDKRTGQTVWITDRSEFPRNYCTPIVAEVEGRKQIVVAATLRVVGYNLATGREQWTVRGIARSACSSPTRDDRGNIYLASWAGGGDPGERIQAPPFDVVAAAGDKNVNGVLEPNELEEGGAIHQRFSQVDRDKTGTITKDEYEFFRGLFDQSRNVMLSIRPGGEGDVTQERVAWEFAKFVPFIASPVFANGCLFVVKDGGILTSLDAKTGEPIKTQRLAATGDYYSSPVAGDGKIFLLSEAGKATIISADRVWQVLSTAEFGEDAYATPAIADGKLFIRTAGRLYCFGVK